MLDSLLNLSRASKLAIAMALDVGLLAICLWAAFALRLSALWPPYVPAYWWLFVLAPITAIPFFVRTGVYHTVIRYIGHRSFQIIAQAVSLHVLVLMGIMTVLGFDDFPRSVLVIYWLICLMAVGGIRFTGRTLLKHLLKARHSPTKVVIFGAGAPGAELAYALQEGSTYLPIAFIDDKRKLQGTRVHGLFVYPPGELNQLVEKLSVNEVLLAIPSASPTRRREVLARLEPLSVAIKTVPGLDDLVTGRAGPGEVRELDVDDLADLLGREPVAPNERLLAKSVSGKSVMVTGAGGSIGSELCRQIRRLNPSRLILLEMSEPALYQIHRELEADRFAVDRSGLESRVEVIPALGNVFDERRVQSIIEAFGVQSIYHAAAYKHVPLVESNPIVGIQNNVLGTWHLANAAQAGGVETFVLISTDKAVRPTNVMGAGKRLAELILQGFAQRSATTRFSMVRFGNVLGSSGSVVPLFNEQIARGGPITVTDPDVVRYFMTIPEAAELVLQAGAMAEGGEVFVLDMGQSIKIMDIARRMVRRRGKRLRDVDNPGGDIAIEFTGLRAGEKMREELLRGDNVAPTEHPRIMRAQEASLPWETLMKVLGALREACETFDSAKVRALLSEAIVDYQPQGEIRDLVGRNGHTPADRTSKQAERRPVYLSMPHLSGREKVLVADALASNWVAPLGPHVDAFEREFAERIGVSSAAAVASGTAALHLALILAGVGAGDEVLVSTLTFAASVYPIRYLNAKPVFIDSERLSWNLDPHLVVEAIEARVRRGRPPAAVIVVHVFGQSANLSPILAICAKHGIAVIEDAAEALGATFQGRPVGSFGRMAVFSFNGNKIITTSGGGMLVTDTPALADRARKLASQAREKAAHYEHIEVGFNYRMSNLLAAVGRGQLEVLDERVEARRRNFQLYDAALSRLPGVAFTEEAPWGRGTRWLTTLTIDPERFGADREDVRLRLQRANIEARPVWKPMHLQPVFAGCEVIGGAVSEELFARGLCLPSGSNLEQVDLDRVVTIIQEVSHEARQPARDYHPLHPLILGSSP